MNLITAKSGLAGMKECLKKAVNHPANSGGLQ